MSSFLSISLIFPQTHYFLLLLLACFSVQLQPSCSNPRDTDAALICSNATAPASERPAFTANYVAALDAVTQGVVARGYATAVKGTGNNTVYAFSECMKDLSASDCNLCFSMGKAQVMRCLPFSLGTRGGRLFYDGCYLRFDDYMFFNEILSAQDRTECGKAEFEGNRAVFGANAMQLVRNLSVEAPKNGGFFVGSVNRGNVSAYGLAQCWKFVQGKACEKCLVDAVDEIGSCTPKVEGRVLNAGCYLRYSTQKFYNNSTIDAAENRGGHRHLVIILPVISSNLALLLIVVSAAAFMGKIITERRRGRKQLGALFATLNKSKLNFSYETLERATNYFHHSNKLGQGGSGSVYKGVLPDGKTVAIKRLFFNTGQWADHFFNEVNLISGIHHKNLVMLLGCSITGERNVRPLSWEVRYNIILDTAEGLAYLHEESKLRIIHRDIKVSNILLEEDFTAKIADFGLARLFPEDRTHISTAIAGTLGYMAPEYVVCGILTEKADIYSFGVLVIEVVSGKRNNSLAEDSLSVLQMLWNLYGTGRLRDAVDPVLESTFQEEQASSLLKIGLLCVQASAELRPSMSVVVKMLNGNHEIPQPTQPPFLNPSATSTPPLVSPSYPKSNSPYSGNDMIESWIEPR
ncbi:cysteine-rich receptor-like protein kinase 3 isoform X3 [Malania oleifera]|uniref:cysteine-rich receptor-like protein kinase 3 isoform X3 n=1 Tax=Malania oleifera TaxID=397392 RepID=UPI0025ADD5E6|nr:cysteine-rich receptor-like protein kinase 3 isoform X3 [Malania oleifera]